jgi:hypothetical protein
MKTQTLSPAAARKVVAAVEAEKQRVLAIMAEARTLGIAAEHVSAAVHAGISATKFVAKHDPAETLARQIIASAKLAGGQ